MLSHDRIRFLLLSTSLLPTYSDSRAHEHVVNRKWELEGAWMDGGAYPDDYTRLENPAIQPPPREVLSPTVDTVNPDIEKCAQR